MASSSDAVASIYEDVGAGEIALSTEVSYLYENADTSVPTPHIWYINPTAGSLGDPITIVGMGFGDSEITYLGSVLLEQLFCAVSQWFAAPSGANAYASNRRIDPSNDTADPEHQRIQVLIPQAARSGNIRVVLNADFTPTTWTTLRTRRWSEVNPFFWHQL